jgi:hypothetical protein
MNSSRDPATSNFCLGTWKSLGHRRYKLNHFALSWDNFGRSSSPQNHELTLHFLISWEQDPHPVSNSGGPSPGSEGSIDREVDNTMSGENVAGNGKGIVQIRQ